MDHFIDAINMSLHSPDPKTGRKPEPAVGELNQQQMNITKEPKTLNHERDRLAHSHDGNTKRAKTSERPTEHKDRFPAEEPSQSHHNSKHEASAPGIHEKTKTATSKESTTSDPAMDRIQNESKNQDTERKHESGGNMTLAESSIDTYDHVLDEADSLLTSFETILDEMKYVSIKNAILMDQLAFIGLDL
jgi:septal ring-binding cell division protein DamX